jgi:hypothetical protein
MVETTTTFQVELPDYASKDGKPMFKHFSFRQKHKVLTSQPLSKPKTTEEEEEWTPTSSSHEDFVQFSSLMG